jgi:hypothetical protein
MMRLPRAGCVSVWLAATLSYLGIVDNAAAHSASDAYLTLTADPSETAGPRVIHGQWDIALRDLDFVLKLDDNGDGRLTWGEVHRHQAAIDRYAYQHLALEGGPGNACSIKPGRQLIDGHADGAYAALFFEAVCARAVPKLTLRYSLFFAIDPSHRGILVMRNGADVSTAVLSPQNARIDLLRYRFESPPGAS